MNKDMRIYIAGHGGMVGSAMQRCLQKAGFTRIITRSHAAPDLKQREKLVAMLISGGAFTPGAADGRVLEVLAQAGAFLSGGVLVSSHAFNTHANMLGVSWGKAAMQTQDMDLASHRQVSVAMRQDAAVRLAQPPQLRPSGLPEGPGGQQALLPAGRPALARLIGVLLAELDHLARGDRAPQALAHGLDLPGRAVPARIAQHAVAGAVVAQVSVIRCVQRQRRGGEVVVDPVRPPEAVAIADQVAAAGGRDHRPGQACAQ